MLLFLFHFQKPLNWLNNDNEIIGRQIGRIQQNLYGNLVIKSVQLEDSGAYTCSNIDGTVAYKIIQLQILGKKTFTRYLQVTRQDLPVNW